MSEVQSMLSRFTRPVIDLMVLNAETAGSMLLRQNTAFGELVQAGVERARAVADAKDLGEAVRLQSEFGREVFEKMSSVGRENWNTVREAYGKAGEVLREAVSPKAA